MYYFSRSGRWFGVAAAVLLGVALVPIEPGPAWAESVKAHATVDYARDVQPILAAHCYQCHGPDKQKHHLRLDRRSSVLRGGDSGEPAVVPGDAHGSYLIKLVRGEVDGRRMPAKGEPLSEVQIATLEAWINAGVSWPNAQQESGSDKLTSDLWSLQPVHPTAPTGEDPGGWARNPIDRYILDKLRENRLTPSPEADRVTLIRRLYFNLIGLLPTPREITRYTNDTSDDWYDRLVNTLLASPRYGERWARHWLDVVRYA